MARAPSALLRREDFPDLADAGRLDRFFRLLNTFFQQTTSALTRNLTVAENLAAGWKEITFTADSTGAVPAATSFAYSLPNGQKPLAVLVGRAAIVGASGSLDTQASVYGPGWIESNGMVIVQNLGGLVASAKYRILFLVLGG